DVQPILVLDRVDLARIQQTPQRGAGRPGLHRRVGAGRAGGMRTPGGRRQVGRSHARLIDRVLVSRALIEDQYATGERRRGEEEDGGGGDQSGQRETIQAHRGDGTLAHPSLRRLQAALQDSQRNTFVRSPIRSSLLILAFLAVPVMLIAGCGGGGGQDPQKVLNDTFSGNKKVTSGKLDLSLTVTTSGVQNVKGPISLSLTGPFQSQGTSQLPKFDFDLKIGAQGQNFTAGAI